MNDEYMSLFEAQRFLRVSQTKLTRLIRDMAWEVRGDPLDKRVKLLKRADVEQVRSVGRGSKEALARDEATRTKEATE